MGDPSLFLEYLHSLLRYGVLLFVAGAGSLALWGRLTRRPIRVIDRSITIIAVVLCHVQLAIGVLLYLMRFQRMEKIYQAGSPHLRYWKYEHLTIMLIAIVLVTLGRILSKRAHMEPRKQAYVAFFFLLALALMLWATPWPFTQMGLSRGWL